MTTRRFACRGLSWSSGPVTLTREGTEFDTEKDAELIDLILKTSVGGVVIELPTKDNLDKSLNELIEKKVQERLHEVEPLSVPDVFEEELAAEAVRKEREETEAAHKKEWEARQKAKEDATPKVIKDFKAKSPKKPTKKVQP